MRVQEHQAFSYVPNFHTLTSHETFLRSPEKHCSANSWVNQERERWDSENIGSNQEDREERPQCEVTARTAGNHPDYGECTESYKWKGIN